MGIIEKYTRPMAEYEEGKKNKDLSVKQDLGHLLTFTGILYFGYSALNSFKTGNSILEELTSYNALALASGTFLSVGAFKIARKFDWYLQKRKEDN